MLKASILLYITFYSVMLSLNLAEKLVCERKLFVRPTWRNLQIVTNLPRDTNFGAV